MLESLFTNNESEDILVYAIIDEDVTEADKKALNDIARKHQIKALLYKTFTEINFNIFPNLENAHVSRTTYYRLFAASLLPNEVDKILYLDGDIIIMDSLHSLWNTDVDGVAVAGTMDQDQSFYQYNRLHYPSIFGYINCGVLVINLKYWRDHQIERRFVNFIYEHSERIKWHDQDVLNYVLKEEKRILPLKYNVQHSFYFKPVFSLIDYWSMESEILDAQKNPIILHFTSRNKPWHIGCKHPQTNVFLDYKKKTIWAECPLIKQKVKQTMKHKLYSYLRMVLVFIHILPHKVNVDKYIVTK